MKGCKAERYSECLAPQTQSCHHLSSQLEMRRWLRRAEPEGGDSQVAIAGQIMAWCVCSGWRKIASDKENTSSFLFASSKIGMEKSQNRQGLFEQGRSSVWGVALSGPPVGLVMGDDFCFTDGACLCYSGGL